MKKIIQGSIKSWTMRFNGVMLVALAAAPELVAVLPELKDYIGDDVYKNLMMITLIGNAILRVKTKSALADK